MIPTLKELLGREHRLVVAYRVIPEVSGALLDRFWELSGKGDSNACWLWKGFLGPKGYGKFFISRKGYIASRVSYQLNSGKPTPTNLMVCHSCDNPSCVNPAHLFLGTNTDNMRDCSKKQRNFQKKKIQCDKGHPFDDKNTGIRGDTGTRFFIACASASSNKANKRKCDVYREIRNGSHVVSKATMALVLSALEEARRNIEIAGTLSAEREWALQCSHNLRYIDTCLAALNGTALNKP